MAAKPDLVGQTVLDRYVIEEVLGTGAMGTVYRAHHAKLKRDVAIKVMHDHLAGVPTLEQRFHREAMLAGKLNHTNVVAVLDVGKMPDGKPVMVMELANGRTLGSLMKGPLPPQRMIPLLVQLLRGLDHAHGVGLVHRDLKPENVILTSDGSEETARIVDFGIAVLRAPDDTVEGGRLTASGVIVGTPQYMAPEQAKGERIDHRADLYALGVIMYEMIGGVKAFDGSAMEVALKKIDQDLPEFSVRAPQISVDRVLDAYMRKLLHRDVEQRFSSAYEALELLELYASNRLAAASRLGVIDVVRASSTISLTMPPRKRSR